MTVVYAMGLFFVGALLGFVAGILSQTEDDT